MDLLDIRHQLDDIDQKIVSLYETRMKLCRDVADFKIKTGKKVFDPEREAQKLDAVSELVESDFDKKAVRELYSQMMTVSRRMQHGILAEHGKNVDTGFKKIKSLPSENKKVVYQGVEGAYAHIAAKEAFGDSAELFNVKTWKDAMDMVLSGKADYAVLPIENSSHGMVSDNFDLLLQYDLYIVKEVDLSVSHALMAVPGTDISKIKKVYSHPQAIGQCKDFFLEHPEIEAVPALNTAVAASMVSESHDMEAAALASEMSAEIYGLEILKHSVNSEKNNTTRFLVMSREKVYTESAKRISLCFETAHKPGALYNLLGSFIFNSVNMSMIQSRPIPEKAFEYRFFVDIEGILDQIDIQNALSSIQDQITALKILGCY